MNTYGLMKRATQSRLPRRVQDEKLTPPPLLSITDYIEKLIEDSPKVMAVSSTIQEHYNPHTRPGSGLVFIALPTQVFKLLAVCLHLYCNICFIV